MANNSSTKQPKSRSQPKPSAPTESVDVRPASGPGWPPGSKGAEPSPYTERVWASVTPVQKRALERLLLQRKQDDPSLPLRWGMSDLIRDLLTPHIPAK